MTDFKIPVKQPKKTPDEWRLEFARRKEVNEKKKARKEIVDRFLKKLKLK